MESFFPFSVEIEMSLYELEEKMKSLEGFELKERPPVLLYTRREKSFFRQSKVYADVKREVVVLICSAGELRHTIYGPLKEVLEVGAFLAGVSYGAFLESYEDAHEELEIFEKKLALEQRKKLRRDGELRV